MSEPCGEDYVCENNACKYWPSEVSGTVSGHVTFKGIAFDENGVKGHPELSLVSAQVYLVDEDGDAVSETDATESDGSYALSYSGLPPGSPVSLRIRPINDAVDVVNGLNGKTYSYDSGYLDVNVGGEHEMNVAIPISGFASKPFVIFDAIRVAYDHALGLDSGANGLPEVVAAWPYALVSGLQYNSLSETILIPEDAAYHIPILLHEYGHHVLATWTGSDYALSFDAHGPCTEMTTLWGWWDEAELAWNEGFASYFAAAVQDAYPDRIQNLTGPWMVCAPGLPSVQFDLETPGCEPFYGMLDEGAIGGILWDIHDVAADEDDTYNTGAGEERIFSIVSTSMGSWSDSPDMCDFLSAWHQWGWSLQEIESILGHHGVWLTTCNHGPEVLSHVPDDLKVNLVEGDSQYFSVKFVDEDDAEDVWVQWYVDNELVFEEGMPTYGGRQAIPANKYTHTFSDPGNFVVTVIATDGWGSSAQVQWNVDVEPWVEPVFEPITSSSLPVVALGWKSTTMARLEEGAGIFVVLDGPQGPYEVGQPYSFELSMFVSDSDAYETGGGSCFQFHPLYVLGCGQSWAGVTIPGNRVTLPADSWEIDAEWKCDWCDEQEEYIFTVFKTVWTVKKYALILASGGVAAALYEAVEEGIEWVAEELVTLAWEAAFGSDDASETWESSTAGFKQDDQLQVWSTDFTDPEDPECWQGGIATIRFDLVFSEPGTVPVSTVVDLWAMAIIDKGNVTIGQTGCAPLLVGDPTFNPEKLVQHFRQVTYLAQVVGGTCGDDVCSDDEDCETCAIDCPGCLDPCGNGFCDPGENCSNCLQDCQPCCGNDLCEEQQNESCLTCPQDCGQCCGDKQCIPYHNESCKTCPEDCGECCGDKTCSEGLGETCQTCPGDCGACCGNKACEATYGENCLTCPADCGACPASCGDKKCDAGETCAGCPVDCGECCGDNACVSQHGETCKTCPADCGSCCGDGSCNFAETCTSCPEDCGDCCGNDVCQGLLGESCETCPADCGECVAGCGDGQCSGLENCATCPSDCGACCGDGECSVPYGEDCSVCPADCGDCCGNGKCEKQLGEDCAQCPQDCGACCGNDACEPQSGETCATCEVDCGDCCGNGACEPGLGEDCGVCPVDCGDCADCGDGTCVKGETCASCPVDCGQCCGNGNCQFGFGETCATCPGDCGECCGDDTCDKSLGETCDSCPADCGQCCGDAWCQAQYGEDCQSCPLDCGACCGDGQCTAGHGEDCESCEVDCGLCPPVCGDGIAEQDEQCDDGNLVNDDGCSNTCTFELAKEGSIIVTEIMANPDKTKDMFGEWFELYNTEKFTIDVNGWVLGDEGVDSHTIDNGGPLSLVPGGYLVLGNNGSKASNGGVDVDYVYSNFFLSEGGDEILLDDGNTTIDAVVWGPEYAIQPGYSLTLHPQFFDYLSNDQVDSWCDAASLLPGGDHGTPGAPNDSCFPFCGDGQVNQPGELCDDGNNVDGDGCAADCTMEVVEGCGDGQLDPGEECDDGNFAPGDGCSPGCTWEPPPVCGDGAKAEWEECDDGNQQSLDGCSAQCELEVLAVGDIIITEVMPNPAGVADKDGEWFEVFNTTTWPIDLDGWELEDDSGIPHLVDSGGPLWVEAGDSFVFGVSGNKATNGGVDMGYVYGSAIQLFHLGDGLVLRASPGGTVIDEFWFDGAFPTKPGYSMTLTPAAYNHLDNDSAGNWCLAPESASLASGDHGSPGEVNVACDGTLCGDGVQEGTEECDPGDAGDWACCTPAFCTAPVPCCGNGVCETPFELCFSCEPDCGPCPCAPACDGKSCLDGDGCGGTCGCADDLVCCEDGSCKTECSCQPDCTGKFCGPDGCGGSCGQCPWAQYTCEAGQCICQPDCTGKDCGSDGCDGSCGTCPEETPFCQLGTCVVDCAGDCTGKECGDDGCGGSCGQCPDENDVCNQGQCVCLPDCTGKSCGPDGCGGGCGECGDDEYCDEPAGQCEPYPVEPAPDNYLDLVEQPEATVDEVMTETVSPQDGFWSDQSANPDSPTSQDFGGPGSDGATISDATADSAWADTDTGAKKSKGGGCSLADDAGVSRGGLAGTHWLLFLLTIVFVIFAVRTSRQSGRG